MSGKMLTNSALSDVDMNSDRFGMIVATERQYRTLSEAPGKDHSVR